MKNALMTPSKQAKTKAKKSKPKEVTGKDDAFDRNFTKDGKPRLNSISGDGAMGQRR